MTDESEEFEAENRGDAGDPAEAFAALRHTVETNGRDLGGEMTVIRKGVEAAFDTFEKFQQPIDYGPELARIVEHLGIVGERLEGIETSPALKNGPGHYARALESAASRVTDNAGRMIESQGHDLKRVAADLSGHIKSARERRVQDWWLWGTVAGGIIVGVFLTLMLPRVLPGSVDMGVAATAMNADRWNAGMKLMESGSPDGWRNLVDANDLVRANQATLADCSAAAARAKKAQQCTITVGVPGR